MIFSQTVTLIKLTGIYGLILLKLLPTKKAVNMFLPLVIELGDDIYCGLFQLLHQILCLYIYICSVIVFIIRKLSGGLWDDVPYFDWQCGTYADRWMPLHMDTPCMRIRIYHPSYPWMIELETIDKLLLARNI